MRLRLSNFTKSKLPFKEDEIPLKTKDKLEEHLQAAISFLQTQQEVLHRTLDILEEVATLGEGKDDDALLGATPEEDDEQTKEKFHELRSELEWLTSLEFNKRRLFSGEATDTSFKLFDKAGPHAPKISQPPVPHHIEPLKHADAGIDPTSVRKMLNALHEMLGQTDAAASDLQTSFTALVSNPEANKELKFTEEKVKSWVSEIMERSDGMSVQAHLSDRQVDGLMRAMNGKIVE